MEPWSHGAMEPWSHGAMEPTVTLARQQLYDLVWSKPMTTIADEFGMSSVTAWLAWAAEHASSLVPMTRGVSMAKPLELEPPPR
jgi:hypothetical protein